MHKPLISAVEFSTCKFNLLMAGVCISGHISFTLRLVLLAGTNFSDLKSS